MLRRTPLYLTRLDFDSDVIKSSKSDDETSAKLTPRAHKKESNLVATRLWVSTVDGVNLSVDMHQSIYG